MNDFAALDDSLIFNGNLYVYTHALVLYDQVREVINFTNRQSIGIYEHEREIREFLLEHLQGFDLYACNHYSRYSTIWDLVYQSSDQKLPRVVRQTFTRAHHAAKREAKRIFEEMVNG